VDAVVDADKEMDIDMDVNMDTNTDMGMDMDMDLDIDTLCAKKGCGLRRLVSLLDKDGCNICIHIQN
jgi:hypothetical protein